VIRRAFLIVLFGMLLSVAQPTACGHRDLRFQAMASLVDARRSFLGDPGPAIVAARTLRERPRAAIYQQDLEVGSAFIYPPIAAKPYELLASMSAADARDALSNASVAMFLAIVAMLARCVSRGWLGTAAAATAALLFFPLIHAVQLNQATLGVTVLLGASLVLIERRAVGAGIALGAACAIKPQLVLVLPILIFHARRTVVAAFATSTAMLVASLVYAGVDNHVAYATRVLPALARGYAYFANQSVNGFLHRLAFDGRLDVFAMPPASRAVALGTATVGIVAYAATAFRVWRLPRSAEVAPFVLGVALLVSTAISPIAWQHHFSFALFVFALLARAIHERRIETSIAVPLACAYVLMASWFEVRYLQGVAARTAVSHVLLGAIVLAVVTLRAAERLTSDDAKRTGRSASPPDSRSRP
jgi:hypothetical protein